METEERQTEKGKQQCQEIITHALVKQHCGEHMLDRIMYKLHMPSRVKNKKNPLYYRLIIILYFKDLFICFESQKSRERGRDRDRDL